MKCMFTSLLWYTLLLSSLVQCVNGYDINIKKPIVLNNVGINNTEASSRVKKLLRNKYELDRNYYTPLNRSYSTSYRFDNQNERNSIPTPLYNKVYQRDKNIDINNNNTLYIKTDYQIENVNEGKNDDPENSQWISMHNSYFGKENITSYENLIQNSGENDHPSARLRLQYFEEDRILPNIEINEINQTDESTTEAETELKIDEKENMFLENKLTKSLTELQYESPSEDYYEYYADENYYDGYSGDYMNEFDDEEFEEGNPCTSGDYTCGQLTGSRADNWCKSCSSCEYDIIWFVNSSCMYYLELNVANTSLLESVSSDYQQVFKHEVVNSNAVKVSVFSEVFNDFFLSCHTPEGDPLCLRKVAIGDLPLDVVNFLCISYNWQRLECTFETQYNPAQDISPYILDCYKDCNNNDLCPCNGNEDFDNYCSINKVNSSHCWSWSGQYYDSYRHLTFNVSSRNPLGEAFYLHSVDQYVNMIPNPAEGLHITNISTSGVDLSWSLPVLMDVFPPGLIHQVQYRIKHQQAWSQIPPAFNNTNSLIKELYPYQTYVFRVFLKSAENNEDSEFWWSNSSEEMEATTLPAIPVLVPEVSPAGFQISEELTLFWKCVEPTMFYGPDFKYLVTINEKTINTTQCKISMPYDEDNYTIFIRSANSVGSSEDSSQVSIPSEEFRLSPPIFKSVIILPNNTILIKWWYPYGDDVTFTLFWCIQSQPDQTCMSGVNWISMIADTSILVTLEDLFYDNINQVKSTRFTVSADASIQRDTSVASGMVSPECSNPSYFTQKLIPPDIGLSGFENESHIELQWSLTCGHWSGDVKNLSITYCEGELQYVEYCEETETLYLDPWIENVMVGPLYNSKINSAWLVIHYETLSSNPSSSFIFHLKHQSAAGPIVWASVTIGVCLLAIISVLIYYTSRKVKIFTQKLFLKIPVPLDAAINDQDLKKPPCRKNRSPDANKKSPNILINPSLSDGNDSSSELMDKQNILVASIKTNNTYFDAAFSNTYKNIEEGKRYHENDNSVAVSKQSVNSGDVKYIHIDPNFRSSDYKEDVNASSAYVQIESHNKIKLPNTNNENKNLSTGYVTTGLPEYMSIVHKPETKEKTPQKTPTYVQAESIFIDPNQSVCKTSFTQCKNSNGYVVQSPEFNIGYDDFQNIFQKTHNTANYPSAHPTRTSSGYVIRGPCDFNPQPITYDNSDKKDEDPQQKKDTTSPYISPDFNPTLGSNPNVMQVINSDIKDKSGIFNQVSESIISKNSSVGYVTTDFNPAWLTNNVSECVNVNLFQQLAEDTKCNYGYVPIGFHNTELNANPHLTRNYGLDTKKKDLYTTLNESDIYATEGKDHSRVLHDNIMLETLNLNSKDLKNTSPNIYYIDHDFKIKSNSGNIFLGMDNSESIPGDKDSSSVTIQDLNKITDENNCPIKDKNEDFTNYVPLSEMKSKIDVDIRVVKRSDSGYVSVSDISKML